MDSEAHVVCVFISSAIDWKRVHTSKRAQFLEVRT